MVVETDQELVAEVDEDARRGELEHLVVILSSGKTWIREVQRA
jgi:hypothetical protein